MLSSGEQREDSKVGAVYVCCLDSTVKRRLHYPLLKQITEQYILRINMQNILRVLAHPIHKGLLAEIVVFVICPHCRQRR